MPGIPFNCETSLRCNKVYLVVFKWLGQLKVILQSALWHLTSIGVILQLHIFVIGILVFVDAFIH